MNMTSRRFSAEFSLQLESLRGVSAIVVLFSHCFQAFIAPFDLTLYSWVRLLGQAAVMMFFALSGYLIGTSIQNNIQQNSHLKQRTSSPRPDQAAEPRNTALNQKGR
jgi:peptidoglycan/LPS O-acetylase OafA/YrhL